MGNEIFTFPNSVLIGLNLKRLGLSSLDRAGWGRAVCPAASSREYLCDWEEFGLKIHPTCKLTSWDVPIYHWPKAMLLLRTIAVAKKLLFS